MRIAILLHESDRSFETTGYLVRALMTGWAAEGHQIDVVRSVQAALAADLVFPHLDLTVTPEPVRAALAHHAHVVNRRLTDISKSAVSSNIVRRGDPWDGPVIVKTDRNHGGQPEHRLGLRAAHPANASTSRPIWSGITGKVALTVARLSRLAHRARADSPTGVTTDAGGTSNAIDWERIETLSGGSYPVFERLRDVPDGVFRNANLVVERFLPERDGDLYCLRYYYICGDREANVRITSPARVIKGSVSTSMTLEPPPRAMRELCQARGIEYGKLDYVIRDGEVVLLDINRTPATSALVRWQLLSTVVGELTEGLAGLVASSGRSDR